MNLEYYKQLANECPIKPIEHKNDYSLVQKYIEYLVMKNFNELTSDNILATKTYIKAQYVFIKEFENKHFETTQQKPEDVLAFLMEMKNITQKELSALTKISQSTISDILNSKRPLTTSHIKTLSNFFSVNPTVFL